MAERLGRRSVRQLLTFCPQSGSREQNVTLSSLVPFYSKGNWLLLLKLVGSDSENRESLPVSSKTPGVRWFPDSVSNRKENSKQVRLLKIMSLRPARRATISSRSH